MRIFRIPNMKGRAPRARKWEKRMKVSRPIVILVAALAIVAIFVSTRPVGAQSARVYPDPLAAKVPHHGHLHRKSALAANANAAIVTEDGPLKGVEIWGGDGYFGIPYAAPPVGNLRWMPPLPHGKFQGVFQANTYGNFCTQPD